MLWQAISNVPHTLICSVSPPSWSCLKLYFKSLQAFFWWFWDSGIDRSEKGSLTFVWIVLMATDKLSWKISLLSCGACSTGTHTRGRVRAEPLQPHWLCAQPFRRQKGHGVSLVTFKPAVSLWVKYLGDLQKWEILAKDKCDIFTEEQSKPMYPNTFS